MNRITALFGVAAALSLTALVLGQKPGPQTSPPPIPLTAPPTPAPLPSPPPPPAPFFPTDGSLSMSTRLSDPVLARGADRTDYVDIDLTGAQAPTSDRAPVNLVLVLDRSGSMAGEKLTNARSAAHALIDRLDERDRLGFVTFGSDVTLLFPSAACSASAREQMHRAVDRIQDRGGTNLSGGLEAGIQQAMAHAGEYPVNRVILISDGEANEGITSRVGLAEISRQSVSRGVSVTALGVGVDFDEDVMEQLAENGGGNYRFLRTGSEIRPIFDNELKQLATSVAANASLQLQILPPAQLEEVYGYVPEASEGGHLQIRLGDFASGEHRKVMLRVRVPAEMGGTQPVATVGLSYTDLLHDRAARSQQASLDVRITDDARLADASRDRGAYAQVARMQTLTATKKAAVLYGSGKLDEAKEELVKGRAQAEATNVYAGDASLGGVMDKVFGGSLRAMSAAPSPSSEAARANVKDMKQSAYELAR